MKSYSDMNIKEKIAYDCGGTQLIDDVNHAVRRFFRCWLDGSYKGEAHYKMNCNFIKKHHDNDQAMRSFVVSEFCKYIASDYNCSVGHAQSCLVLAINRDDLERLNDLLVEDAKDLVADAWNELGAKEEEE